VAVAASKGQMKRSAYPVVVLYGELLAKGLPSMYHVADTWPNYDKLKKRIDQRYREWKGETSGGWRSLFRKPW
jgi:hypothetical protein